MLAGKLQVSEDALFQEIGGEAVILDLASSSYFGLNAVGARFWQLAAEGAELSAVCDALLGEFEVERETLEQDLRDLLVELSEAGLARWETA